MASPRAQHAEQDRTCQPVWHGPRMGAMQMASNPRLDARSVLDVLHRHAVSTYYLLLRVSKRDHLGGALDQSSGPRTVNLMC